MNRFSGHDKRVTLNLALHSKAAQSRDGLIAALQAAKEAGWDLNQLPQAAVECIYANFDEEFEKLVVSEFEADPGYLLDLYPNFGTCPLCGHVGIRWVFRVQNKNGGTPIECGSECIITWGISVKGTETAEAAKAVLEGQIRRAIRALLVKEWHTETGFTPDWFRQMRESFQRIHEDRRLPWSVRSNTYYKYRDLKKLERFYDRTGWLNTMTRWEELRRLVNYARANDSEMKLPHLNKWVSKADKAAATKAAMAASGVVTEALAPKNVRPGNTMELPLGAPAVKVEVPVAPAPVETTAPVACLDPEAAAQQAELEWIRSQAGKTPADDSAPYAPGEEAKVVAAQTAGDWIEAENLAKGLEAAAEAALEQAADLAEVKAAEYECSAPAPAPVEKAVQMVLSFEAVSRELVFGK